MGGLPGNQLSGYLCDSKSLFHDRLCRHIAWHELRMHGAIYRPNRLFVCSSLIFINVTLHVLACSVLFFWDLKTKARLQYLALMMDRFCSPPTHLHALLLTVCLLSITSHWRTVYFQGAFPLKYGWKIKESWNICTIIKQIKSDNKFNIVHSNSPQRWQTEHTSFDLMGGGNSSDILVRSKRVLLLPILSCPSR